MSRKKTNKRSTPLFIIFIAIILIAFGLVRISLGFLGEKDTAIITNIRRQGGERNDPIPNRYNYSISYTFTLPDGKKVDGFTTKIDNAVYVKVSDSNPSTTTVRYLKALPVINAPEADTGLNMGNLIIIGAGILVIKLLRIKKKNNKI